MRRLAVVEVMACYDDGSTTRLSVRSPENLRINHSMSGAKMVVITGAEVDRETFEAQPPRVEQVS